MSKKVLTKVPKPFTSSTNCPVTTEEQYAKKERIREGKKEGEKKSGRKEKMLSVISH